MRWIGSWAAAAAVRRRTMATAGAVAAAISLVASPAAVAQSCGSGAFNGLSVGIDGGLARTGGDSSFTRPALTFPGSRDFTASEAVFGSVLGARVGYNLQCQSIVLGIEADYSKTRLQFNQTYYDPFNSASGGFRDNQLAVSSEIDRFATVRARLGWAFTPSLLVYATGGLAYAHVNHGLNWTYQGVGAPNVSATAVSDTAQGWTFGGGLEYAIGNWSLRGEALHVDLGSSSQTFRIPLVFGAAATTQSAHWDDSFWVARVGLTYRILP